MTNKEIKFELGKIALQRCQFPKVDNFTALLVAVYKWIIEEPEEKIEMPDKRNVDYSKEDIREVIKHIHRNDGDRRGYGRRAVNIFNINEITTIGQLLDMGRYNFIRIRDVGCGLCSRIDNALYELYGIEKW